VLRQHCAEVGRDPKEIQLTVMNDFRLTEDRADARKRLERAAQFRNLSVDEVRDRVWIGNADELTELIGGFADAGFSEAILGLGPPYGAATFDMLEAAATAFGPRVRA
jgi:alkanesulfonate monooxygenase SsuD/methylene tetrahydromethanopterin reductase-like flavin-dependent oxidoreductase (luciferase family)